MSKVGHGYWKFPKAEVLATSADRHWTGVAAELRSHPRGEIPPITSAQTEVTLTLSGDGSSYVHRRGNGAAQQTSVAPGTLWLCPMGIAEDSIFISEPIERVAHVYLPPSIFTALAQDDVSLHSPPTIDYLAGFIDPLVEQIVLAIVAELLEGTAAGRLLVETLALSLTARLTGSYATERAQLPALEGEVLGTARLERVLDYIGTEIEGDLSIQVLADVACLSRFHFSRAFRNAVGMTPHRYVSTQRLTHAKTLLSTTERTLADIAFACGFSSQANFNRSFVRSTGTTPGKFRRKGMGALAILSAN